MIKIKRAFILFSLLSLFLAPVAMEGAVGDLSNREAKVLRFPHIKGDKIVFVHAGDLYIGDATGGVARRLTSSIGYEMFPRFSPDGKWIAFTAQYDGNSEVYLIPSEGGEPKRLTYTASLDRDDVGDRMGPDNIVLDWTPDGKQILYRTRGFTFNDFTGQLMKVSIEGGLSEMVPLKNGGFANYSPDGKELAYNYIFREFRDWKRYEGGMADDIRVFNFKSKKSRQITNNVSQNVFPMWSANGSKLFYSSDRDGYMNLYCYNLTRGDEKQVTHYKEYDVKFPSASDNTIVYEHGGDIVKLNMLSGKEERLTFYINNDIAWSRSEWKYLGDKLRTLSLSPNGERIMATARGSIFSIPAKEGITYNLSNSSASNEKFAEWSPKGDGYAYVSDKDGEFNIWYKNSAGEERRLTDVKTHILGMGWSPDGKKIAWSEKLNSLNILDVATGKNVVVERSPVRPFSAYNWSPESDYLVYTRPEKGSDIVVLYNVESGEKVEVTDKWFNSTNANFSADGNYLLFTSARTFNPTYGQTEWNHVYINMYKIYLVPLREDAPIPFAPKNDEVALVDGQKEESNNSGDKGSKKEKKGYNLENLSSKVIELPVAPSFYGSINMVGDNVYFATRGGTKMLNLKSKKESDLNVSLFFSANYKKAIAYKGGRVEVIAPPVAPVTISNPISLKGVRKLVDYREEWMQIYNESWRQMRDYFYAKNMHGVDWDVVKERYGSLVPYINHRSDLTYLIGEMIAELNVGHAYSQNGEHPSAPRVLTGLLGAEFSRDRSGYFKIEKIIEGANWSKKLRSPLTMPGLDVKEGDYIISINGRSLTETNDIFHYLVGTADQLIEMEVNSSPKEKGARTILVTPIANEADLRYYDWVQTNIKKVEKATNGEVGYIHIPDMGPDGLNEFVKHYYPQLNKKALIIDDRGNGGGNVSPMLIERLQRTAAYFSMHTNQHEGDINPVGTFQGPKVLLINEYSASDGDLFPYRFRHYNLGTIIGRRSWGGVVGYSGTVPVVDGGSIVTPSYAPFAADGSGWIIEGTGVAPDIDLFNDPYREFNGEDQQLNKAIEVVLEQMKGYEYLPATIPPFPNKSVR